MLVRRNLAHPPFIHSRSIERVSAACAHRRAIRGRQPDTTDSNKKKQPKPKAMGAEASAPEASPRDPAFSEREPQSATSWLFGTDLLCGGDAGCTLTYTCLPDPSKGEFQVDQAVSAAARDTRSRRVDGRIDVRDESPEDRGRGAAAPARRPSVAAPPRQRRDSSAGCGAAATRIICRSRRRRGPPVPADDAPRSAGPCTGVRLDRPKHERRDRGSKQ